MIKTKRLTVIFGHYGCGKTNLSINLALSMAKEGKKVTLVDMDIVNPYFRSSDYTNQLKEKGIEVISPQFAGTNLDTPSLSPKVYSVFSEKDRYIIFDVGGDDAGAFALGRFRKNITDFVDFEAYYVVNKYRKFTDTPANAVDILKEIEKACSISATGIINNSHLQKFTTKESVLDSLPYANEISKSLNLPLVATTVPMFLANDKIFADETFYAVDIIVKPPF